MATTLSWRISMASLMAQRVLGHSAYQFFNSSDDLSDDLLKWNCQSLSIGLAAGLSSGQQGGFD